MLVTGLTGIVFGLAPAWHASRADAAEAMKKEGRTATAGMGLRTVLVTGQLALALILLTGAGLLIRSFARLHAMDPGFDPQHVLAIPMRLPATRYAEIPTQTRFRRELLDRLNALPGVKAAMVGDPPLNGNHMTHRLAIEGRTSDAIGVEPEVDTMCVMGDYFGVMRAPMLRGRGLTEMDREGHPLVAVVNEALARAFFRGTNPIGQRIRWARDPDERWMTIVGVAGDLKQSSLAKPAYPAVFTPFAQSDEAWRRWMSVMVRTEGDPDGALPGIKRAVWSLDGGIPLDHIESMDAMVGESLSERRFDTVLLGLFAGLAVMLSAIGVYGMMAYAVSQRTQEIGIRMAIGARRGDVVAMVMRQGAWLAMTGLVAGVTGAFALTRVMVSLLFDVAPGDPLTFVTVTVLMLALTLLAAYIPARRASRVDPMLALRYE
jgi:putative ABC transport system permease protein